MATNLISSLFSASLLKIVHEGNGYEYWHGLAVQSVAVVLDAAVTDNPISNKSHTEESLYTDLLDVDTSNGKILRPVKLKITAICDNFAIVESMMGVVVDQSVTFRITSKAIISESMMPIDLSIDQAPGMTSAVGVVIEFEQFAPPIPSTFDPKDPANRSTFGIRIQLPESTIAGAGAKIAQTVSGLFKKVSSLF